MICKLPIKTLNQKKYYLYIKDMFHEYNIQKKYICAWEERSQQVVLLKPLSYKVQNYIKIDYVIWREIRAIFHSTLSPNVSNNSVTYMH